MSLAIFSILTGLVLEPSVSERSLRGLGGFAVLLGARMAGGKSYAKQSSQSKPFAATKRK
jgi:hypothetical protein